MHSNMCLLGSAACFLSTVSLVAWHCSYHKGEYIFFSTLSPNTEAKATQRPITQKNCEGADSPSDFQRTSPVTSLCLFQVYWKPMPMVLELSFLPHGSLHGADGHSDRYQWKAHLYIQPFSYLIT